MMIPMDNPRDIRSDGSYYPVIEMFTSVQSEGSRAGTLNHFLRLGGCNLRCSFCDTPMDEFEMMRPEEIAARLHAMERESPADMNLVITGGEPLVHNLLPLLTALGMDFYIAVESNGSRLSDTSFTFELAMALARIDWLTVSPKTKIPYSYLWKYAKEVKYVVPDFENLIAAGHPQVFVQPEFNNPDALERCLHWMRKHPQIRLSVQTHKYLGLR